jgi:hypothetical protein
MKAIGVSMPVAAGAVAQKKDFRLAPIDSLVR